MADAPETTKTDYRSTVFLPRTDFPMKAGLPQKEPGIAARWEDEGLYQQIRRARDGREKFIFHDGPPYANGDMHIGHALNHTLKDMVVRTQTLLGKDAPYVPGWDCHGLPIEWKVEEQYRKKKLNKDEVPAKEFRAECRAYAQHWVDVQREQLKRLGISADWDKPYLTMAYFAEGTIVSELFKFAESGQLYRGAKPVMWSPVEKTALAEAEIEYEDITSTQIDVAFEIVESPVAELIGARAVIWTTTPWTIPVNQAIAYGPDVEYAAVRFGERVLIIAKPLLADFEHRLHPRPPAPPPGPGELGPITVKAFGLVNAVWEGKGSDLAGTIARHPMHKLGGFFAKPRPFLPGDFVTTDQGTGLVHMAPDHGEDDFELCRANGIDPVFAVDAAGFYRPDWLWLGGQGSVINNKFNAPDGPICSDLRDVGALLAASADFQHSYPHSWRSKAKVIYRCTPQWFIAMDREIPGGGTLRSRAMQAIADTRFVPEKGRNRLGSMVEGRPDWVISRQRAWGVPIALFVEKKSGELLFDRDVNRRIVEAITKDGVDAWDPENAAHFLGNRNPDDYEMVTDILDVWFDSGCTHVFVLESGHWPEERWPADLYLEGSDQHRGWFQSSLLESCGTRGRAPYDAVLTHGFALDGQGRKMSKSLGNVVDPLKVIAESGSDILRVWVASTDYFDDVRIGKEVLAGSSDAYRKLRNSFRYLLGALSDFSEEEKLPVAEMPELERYMLHRLASLDADLKAVVDKAAGSENWLEFSRYTRALFDFANSDLSAFFFDIRKDCLYCDAKSDPKRRAYRTVLDTLFHALVRYAAPIIPFTAEEVWQSRYPNPEESVHFLEWPEVDAGWANDSLDDKWTEIRNQRDQVNEAIEPLRREKIVRSSLEADVTMGVLVPSDGVNFAEIAIVARVEMGKGDGIAVKPSDWHKCGRCWRLLPEVEEDGTLCNRCDEVLAG